MKKKKKKMCYSIEPKDQIFVKEDGFYSFAKNMSKNIVINITKNLSGKTTRNLSIILIIPL